VSLWYFYDYYQLLDSFVSCQDTHREQREKIMPFPMRTEQVTHFIRLTGKGKGTVHPRAGHEGLEVE